MGEVFPILSSVSFPYLYLTNLSALIGLRILTLYSLFDLTVHTTFPFYSTFSQDHSPCPSISNSRWFIPCFITLYLSLTCPTCYESSPIFFGQVFDIHRPYSMQLVNCCHAGPGLWALAQSSMANFWLSKL